jgi:hypothetical protein
VATILPHTFDVQRAVVTVLPHTVWHEWAPAAIIATISNNLVICVTVNIRCYGQLSCVKSVFRFGVSVLGAYAL